MYRLKEPYEMIFRNTYDLPTAHTLYMHYKEVALLVRLVFGNLWHPSLLNLNTYK